MTTIVKKKHSSPIGFLLESYFLGSPLDWNDSALLAGWSNPATFAWLLQLYSIEDKMLTGSPQQRGVQLDHRLPTALLSRTFSTHALVIWIKCHQNHFNIKINTATQNSTGIKQNHVLHA